MSRSLKGGGCIAMVVTMFALGLASIKHKIPKNVIVFDHGIFKVRTNSLSSFF